MIGKRITICCNLWLIAFMVSILTPGCDEFSCKNGTLLVVHAKPKDWSDNVLTATSIEIEKGSTLFFSASGIWDIGLGSIGPNGKEDWCECPVSKISGSGFKGNLGALIGRIGVHGEPFIIGDKKTITAGESGVLFLGSNDNMAPCDGHNRGSCYKDNKGFLIVCIKFTN